MSDSKDDSVQLSIGSEQIVLQDRYELASVTNDIVLALWFIVGSVLFFWESTATWGTWCFLLGSVQLGIRPTIRLTRRVHLRRVTSGKATDDGFDY